MLPHSLLDAPNQRPCRVVAVHAPAHSPQWGDWLQQLGFIHGELVTVLLRSQPGGDPLAVRVGQSTFALRKAEAACIEVTFEPLDATTPAANTPAN